MTRRPRSFESQRALGGVLALGLLLFAPGCWFSGGSGGGLRDGARAIVPDGASVVAEEEGDCVELARSPSCVHVYFITEPAPLSARTRAVEEGAERGGWELERKELAAGGASLRFRRRGATAVVYLWNEQRAAPCRERPRRDCADVVMVERSS